MELSIENVGHFLFFRCEHLVLGEHAADRIATDALPFDVCVDALWIAFGV